MATVIKDNSEDIRMYRDLLINTSKVSKEDKLKIADILDRYANTLDTMSMIKTYSTPPAKEN